MDVLYKKDSFGRIRTWHGAVRVDAPDVFYQTKSGVIGGTGKSYEVKVKGTKTLTPLEKATSKLKSAYDQKLKDGYFKTKEEAMGYKPDKLQLLHKWEDHKDKIVYPCFVSPKLDGVCAAYMDDEVPFFKSRENNQFSKLNAFAMNISIYLNEVNIIRAPVHAHGELYAHGYKVSEIIEGLKGSSDEIFSKLKFYIFDYMGPDATKQSYVERLKLGSDTYGWGRGDSPVEFIAIQLAHNEHDVDFAYNKALKDGFEGIVVSNLHDKGYEYGGRSYNRLKRKEKFTEEFQIVAINYEEHTIGRLAIFTCETAHGNQFDVVPAWSKEKRAEAWLKATSLLSKWATVEFRSWTKYGVPFHPVMLSIRDYE